jgi:His/Glu/Gln/Arg/opine family amino acid ABC transporter permease subunit
MNDQWLRLLEGARLTLEVSLLATMLGTAIGVLAAVASRSGKLLKLLVAIYVSFIRGTPLFVQILVVYFILPGFGLDLTSFNTGVVVLSINSGAYISEMIRGALTAIPRGQIEAAQALAFSSRKIWTWIVLPQVFRLIVAPLTVELTALLKASALLSIIGVVELTRTAQQIIAVTYAPLQTWLVVGVLYFVMCCALGLLTRGLERAISNPLESRRA